MFPVDADLESDKLHLSKRLRYEYLNTLPEPLNSDGLILENVAETDELQLTDASAALKKNIIP